jgi:hypothetical protein
MANAIGTVASEGVVADDHSNRGSRTMLRRHWLAGYER